MSSHQNLDAYLDDVLVALAALEKLGRIPRSAAHSVALHFIDMEINTPVPVMELSPEEKIHFQRTALEEMVYHIEKADRSLAEPEIYAALAPDVDPLFRLLVSARAEEFNEEGLGDEHLSIEDCLEETCGMSIDDLVDRISSDPHIRELVGEVVLPGITGLTLGQLKNAADHDPEIRSLLERLGID